jgi:ribosomal protein S18 acetylase RimI-like enzyme
MLIEELRMSDYAEAYALWSRTEGMGLSDADAPESVARYLSRNPGTSTVAREGDHVVATALAGHDGRRGYLHHVAVDPAFRGRGLGRDVVARSIRLLREAGIERCHLFIFGKNETGQAFWRAVGWRERTDLRIYSRDTGELPAQAPS